MSDRKLRQKRALWSGSSLFGRVTPLLTLVLTNMEDLVWEGLVP